MIFRETSLFDPEQIRKITGYSLNSADVTLNHWGEADTTILEDDCRKAIPRIVEILSEKGVARIPLDTTRRIFQLQKTLENMLTEHVGENIFQFGLLLPEDQTGQAQLIIGLSPEETNR